MSSRRTTATTLGVLASTLKLQATRPRPTRTDAVVKMKVKEARTQRDDRRAILRPVAVL